MNALYSLISYLKSTLNIYLVAAILLFVSSVTFADNCTNLLGPVAGPLPGDIVSATVIYADYRQPNFTPGPNFETPTGSPTPNCFIIASIDTDVSDPSVVKLDLVLPPPTSWNQKFIMVGQGGFAGGRNALNRISVARLATFPIDRGYATSTTDTGHFGATSANWALIDIPGVNNEPELNFAYRGVHVSTVVGKKLTEQFYGQAIYKSYFVGFSNGGRQGLMEAARYPNDYDGIAAGAPAKNISGFLAESARVTQLQFPDPNSLVPLLQTTQYNLISSRVLSVCDGVDGIVDGIVADPRNCDFDVERDIPVCPGDVPDASCLTKAQRDVVKAVTHKMKLSNNIQEDGREISKLPGEWSAWVGNLNVTGSLYFFVRESIRYFMEDNATATVQGYPLDPNKFMLNTPFDVPKDLTNYINHSGKLIIFHGWDDAALSPRDTINFYKDVTNGLGKHVRDAHIRLFMLPAFGHAVHRYSSGTANYDFLTALEKWVELGIAPEAVNSTDDTGNIIRPWCQYPKVAVRINPSLPDPNFANYECREP